jgi:Peptidase family M1 domain
VAKQTLKLPVSLLKKLWMPTVKHILTQKLTYAFIRNTLFVFGILVNSHFAYGQQSYFQQDLKYRIEVLLNDKTHSLKGNLDVEYTNNSDDTLAYIYFHLYPNAYKNRETALVKQQLESGITRAFFASDDERGYIDSLNFNSENSELKWNFHPDHIDICLVELLNPLFPGSTININTPFYVKLPSANSSRLGHQKQAYYITQWYPKPAVYDNNGWNVMPYLDQGEFYSEFGNYNVTVTLPTSYLVASSGRAIIDNRELHNSGDDMQTIKFQRDSIHDFAWFANKLFIKKEKKIYLENGKEIKCKIFYNSSQSQYWDSAFSYIENSLILFSKTFGIYPYDEFTLVDGLNVAGINMEYPCIALIGSPYSFYEFENVIAHEVAHMWSYSALGVNERRNAWMDEGLATFGEFLYSDAYYPGVHGVGKNELVTGVNLVDNFTGFNDLTRQEVASMIYLSAMRLHKDLPPGLSSEKHTSMSYVSSVYYKSALSFDLLRKYLGEDEFDKCLRLFFEIWKFKHPAPDDLVTHFEKCSGENLSWFLKNLIYSNNKPDVELRLNKKTNEINISDNNNLSIPVLVTEKSSASQSSQWLLSSDTSVVKNNPAKNHSYLAESAYIPDFNPHTNTIKSNGHKNHKLLLKYGTSPGLSPHQSALYYLPALAYNEYNKLMIGATLHNYSFVPKSLEFSLIPLFDFVNLNIAGIGSINKRWYFSSSVFEKLLFNVSVARFAYDDNFAENTAMLIGDDPLWYNRINGKFDFRFRSKNIKSTSEYGFSISQNSVFRDVINYIKEGDDFVPFKESKYFGFQTIELYQSNNRTIDPFNTKLRIESGDKYAKAILEINYKFSYSKHGKGIDIRFHFGKFIYNDQLEYNYNFRMDGWSGADDYLYSDYYFGRSETNGLWNSQFLVKDGGFKVPTAVGQSNNWNSALNITIDTPTPLPVKFFIDIGTYDGIKDVFEDLDNIVMFDAGLVFSIGKGAFEIYLPFFISEDIKKNHEANDLKFSDRIRFVFDIKKMNPVDLRNKWHEQ